MRESKIIYLYYLKGRIMIPVSRVLTAFYVEMAMELSNIRDSVLFDTNPNPMMIFEVETLRIRAVNRMAVQIYGYPEEEFLELTIKDIRPPEDLEILEENFDRVKESLRGPSFRHQTKEGEPFYVQINAQDIELDGKTHRLVSISDVTSEVEARLEAQQALRELNAHVSNTPLAMVKWDYRFRIIEFTDTAARLTGYTREEAIGMTPLDFNLPDDMEEQIRGKLQQLEQGEVDNTRFELDLYDRSGNLLHLKLHNSALLDNNGQLLSILTFIEDLTEKREVEKVLERDQKFREAVLANINAGIVALDARGELSFLNKKARDFHQLEDEQSLPPNPDIRYSIINENGERIEYTDTDLPIYQALRGDRVRDLEMLVEYADGTHRVLLVNSSPILNESSTILGAVVVLHDITDRKKDEEKLQKSLEQNRILLAEVHHRVKNNLAMISGLFDLQLIDVADPEVEKTLQDNQMRVLSIAKIHEVLYQSEDFAQISFGKYLKRLIEHVSDTYEKKKIEIKTHLTDEVFNITLDQAIPAALILNEVLSNIFKHAFEDQGSGRIQVSLSREQEKVHIEVCDNGKGMPMPFEELLAETQSLGLTLIDSLSRQLNGDLKYGPTGERGTRFSLRFTPEERSSIDRRLE